MVARVVRVGPPLTLHSCFTSREYIVGAPDAGGLQDTTGDGDARARTT
jgi:hypothetical protein